MHLRRLVQQLPCIHYFLLLFCACTSFDNCIPRLSGGAQADQRQISYRQQSCRTNALAVGGGKCATSTGAVAAATCGRLKQCARSSHGTRDAAAAGGKPQAIAAVRNGEANDSRTHASQRAYARAFVFSQHRNTTCIQSLVLRPCCRTWQPVFTCMHPHKFNRKSVRGIRISS